LQTVGPKHAARGSPSTLFKVEMQMSHYPLDSSPEISSQAWDSACVCVYARWLRLSWLGRHCTGNSSTVLHIALFTVSLILTFLEVFPVQKPLGLDFVLC